MFGIFRKRNLENRADLETGADWENRARTYKIEDLLTLPIKEKIDFLKRYDRNYQIFGSEKHKYILREPLSEAAIADFEDTFKVKLPGDYRNFINTIGNGGAGPGYGLFPLTDNEKSYQNKFLSSQFLLKEDFDAALYEEQIPCDCLDCKVCDKKDICLLCEVEKDTFKYQLGTLAVCFSGCTYYSRLVMDGQMRGEIWSESEGEGLKRIQRGFLTWYENWLDISIKIILPFVNAVISNMSFDEILQIKGSNFFNYDFTKAKFVAGMLDFHIDMPTNSGALQNEYMQAVKKAYGTKLR